MMKIVAKEVCKLREKALSFKALSVPNAYRTSQLFLHLSYSTTFQQHP